MNKQYYKNYKDNRATNYSNNHNKDNNHNKINNHNSNNKQKHTLNVFNDIKYIINRFPSNIIMNNNNIIIANIATDSEYYILKPRGRKGYLWFTYYKKEMICLLIFLNNKNINDESNEFYRFTINYDNTLCYNNVLLCGTYFYKYVNANSCSNLQHYYIIDNVLNYNNVNNFTGQNINKESYFILQLNLCKKVIQYIKNNNYSVYLGIILDNYDDIFKIIYNLNYDIYSIACYNQSKCLGNFILGNTQLGNVNKNACNYGYNFKVTACITPDIYNLYILDNNKEIFYDNALIDTYKISVFMNNLFRKIKENNNLDLLEESDEEEEFENTDLEKYVDLKKSYIIECFYNKKFRKWVPRSLAKTNNIIDKIKINLIINKNKFFL